MFESNMMTSIKFNISKPSLEFLLMGKHFSAALCMIESFQHFHYEIELSEVNGIRGLVMFCLCQPFDFRNKFFNKLNNYDCTEEEASIAISGRVFDFFHCCKRKPLSSLLINSFRSKIVEHKYFELIPFIVEGKWNEILLRTFFRNLTMKQMNSKICDLDEVELVNIIPFAIQNQCWWPFDFFIYVSDSLSIEHVFDFMMNPTIHTAVKKSFLKLMKAPLIRTKSVLNDAIRFGWTDYFHVIDDDFAIGIDEIFFDETSIREAVRLKRLEFVSFVLRNDSFVDVVIDACIDDGNVGVLEKTHIEISNRRHIHFRNVCEKRLICFIELFDLNEEMTEIMIGNRIGVHSNIASRALIELAFEARDFDYICKFIHKHFKWFETRFRENFSNLLFRTFHDENMSKIFANICIDENLTEPLNFILKNSRDKFSMLMIIQQKGRWDVLNGKLLPQIDDRNELNAKCQCNVFDKNVFFRCGHFTHCWNCLRNNIVVVNEAIWRNCPRCLTIQQLYIIDGCPPNEKLYLDQRLWKVTCDKTDFTLFQQ